MLSQYYTNVYHQSQNGIWKQRLISTLSLFPGTMCSLVCLLNIGWSFFFIFRNLCCSFGHVSFEKEKKEKDILTAIRCLPR